jgi:hypothetical protein
VYRLTNSTATLYRQGKSLLKRQQTSDVGKNADIYAIEKSRSDITENGIP